MNQTAVDREAIEERANRATPGTSGRGKGPGWRVSQNRHPTTQGQSWGTVDAFPHPALGAGTPPKGISITWQGDEGRDNAEFIAHARTDVPALLASIRALEAELSLIHI